MCVCVMVVEFWWKRLRLLWFLYPKIFPLYSVLLISKDGLTLMWSETDMQTVFREIPLFWFFQTWSSGISCESLHYVITECVFWRLFLLPVGIALWFSGYPTIRFLHEVGSFFPRIGKQSGNINLSPGTQFFFKIKEQMFDWDRTGWT